MTNRIPQLAPTHIAYWITTATVASSFLYGGLACIAGVDQQVRGMTELGYPLYFVALLGVAKCLGAITLVAPRFPLLKEWAYAGIAFDLIAASVSHAATAHSSMKVLAPAVFLGLTAVSWALRPASRRIVGAVPRVGGRDVRVMQPA